MLPNPFNRNELPPPDILAGQNFPPLPQQNRSRRKRQALLDAALLLFRQQRYKDTSIDHIAKEAGVAIGAFYQHFSTKYQILLVLMDQFLKAMMEVRIPAENITSPKELIMRFVQQGLHIDENYAGVFRAWREAIVQEIRLQALQQQIEEWTTMRLESLTDQLILLPDARTDVDTHDVAWILSLLFWRLIEHQEIDRLAFDVTLSQIIYRTLFKDSADG